jgi:hypothetical protein
MNLADQMKADINFNKIVSQLQREFSSGKSQVY